MNTLKISRRNRKDRNKAVRLAKAKRRPKIKPVTAKSNPKVYTAEERAAFLATRPDLVRLAYVED